jgi:hypothetical protein
MCDNRRGAEIAVAGPFDGVDPGVDALCEAIAALSGDDAERSRMVQRAQRRMIEAGLTLCRYAQRHAMGSGWPIDRTPNPSVMKIDYVHVFAPPPAEATASGTCGDNDLTDSKAREGSTSSAH